MRVGIGQSRWVHRIHCVRSVGKFLLRNERNGCLESQLSQQKPFSHRGRAVTMKERDVVRENRSKKERATGPLESERACWYPSLSKFVVA